MTPTDLAELVAAIERLVASLERDEQRSGGRLSRGTIRLAGELRPLLTRAKAALAEAPASWDR